MILNAVTWLSCQSQVASKKHEYAPKSIEYPQNSEMSFVDSKSKAPIESVKILEPTTPLDGQTLQEFLLAEMAYQQQDYAAALAMYYLLAQRVNDPEIAKKAAKIAAYLSQDEILSQMLDIWLAVYPDNQEALLLGLSNSLVVNQFDLFEQRFHKVMAQNDAFDVFALLGALPVNFEAFAQLERLLVRLQKQYDHPQLFTLMAIVLEHQGKFEQAIDVGGEAILRFDNPMVRLMMIKSYQVLGQTDKADDLLEQSYEIYTSDRNIAEARIQLAWRRSQFEVAYSMTRKMHERHPGDPNLAYQYARLALKQKDYKQAKLTFESLLIYPTLEDEMNYSLGLIADEQKDFELALRYFSKVNPSKYYQNAQYFRASIIWKATENTADVVAIFDQLLQHSELEDKVTISILEAEFWTAIQQYQIGLERIETPAMENSENLGLQYQYSLMLDSAGQVEKSLSILNELLEKKPDDADVLNAYGYVLGNRTNQIELALTYVKKALSIQPDNPATLDSMGWLLYKQGDYTNALVYLNQAFDNYKNDEVAAHLGAVLWRLGQRKKAQEIWQQGYVIQPNSVVINEIKQSLNLD